MLETALMKSGKSIKIMHSNSFYCAILTEQKSHRPAEIVSSPAASSGTGGCCTSGVTTAGLATISTGLH